MNGSMATLVELDAISQCAAQTPDVDVVICPPFPLIVAAQLRTPDLPIGGQDCHWLANGAHTGCVSAVMLRDAGARYCIVGHSERRTDNFETSDMISRKADAAIESGLVAILCVGEPETVRQNGDAVSFVEQQLAGSLPGHGTAGTLVIAYEPIWAIGTGKTPTLDDIAEIHAAIRKALSHRLGGEAQAVRILYGGSVKPDNAQAILALEDVDGALVGGASLKAVDFQTIIAAA